MGISIESFGSFFGNGAKLYTLTGECGLRVALSDAGAAIVSIMAPDRKGRLEEITLGFDSAEAYEKNTCYLGVTVGRHANRISNAAFTLDGRQYPLAANDGTNHLHGGIRGFHTYLWNCEIISDGPEPSLAFSMISPDGDEGYPGELDVRVVFKLNKAAGLEIDYSATASENTICNLTNHSYFNLTGESCEHSLKTHLVRIAAQGFCTINKDCMPTGEVSEVADTPFDFRLARPISDGINADCEQIRNGGGYDHCFCLDKTGGKQGNEPACEVIDPKSGRALYVYTNQPGLQFYTGNSLTDVSGRGGSIYGRRAAFCLETQLYPDGTEHRNFPSPVLKRNETYRHRCEYRFGIV